ncbi:hypothetical protein [Deinococcus sp. SL84]|uniref:hypothetical protein n=1 Tax=Deinococcus sp. SL84 TaxID=2994663 RepID=UPI002272DCFF|nr:hypothetical protein [Deinococcus sp. SL84]MCY1703939.1 hypothetical protein [Deinococcus sp. SL84]
MTSYLDDAWLEAEMQRFEESKEQLLAAATLFEQTTSATSHLERSLNQLAQQDRQTKKGLEQLADEKRREIDESFVQSREEFGAHVQQVLARLSTMGEAGQVLQVSQDVAELKRTIPALELQALQLTEVLGKLRQQALSRTAQLEEQLGENRSAMEALIRQQSELTADQKAYIQKQLTAQENALRQTLSKLSAEQQELQKSYRKLDSYQQTQGSTIQRVAQMGNEMNNANLQKQTKVDRAMDDLQQRLEEVLERLTHLEQRQTATETGLSQLEARLSGQIAACQDQLEEKILAHFGSQLEQIGTVERSVKHLELSLQNHQQESAIKREVQVSMMTDLQKQIQSGQNKAARFIAWFEKAGPLGRMNGKPE